MATKGFTKLLLESNPVAANIPCKACLLIVTVCPDIKAKAYSLMTDPEEELSIFGPPPTFRVKSPPVEIPCTSPSVIVLEYPGKDPFLGFHCLRDRWGQVTRYAAEDIL